jgi:hypothetical protein
VGIGFLVLERASCTVSVLEQVKSGRTLSAKDGAFASLLKNILNAVSEGEKDASVG